MSKKLFLSVLLIYCLLHICSAMSVNTDTTQKFIVANIIIEGNFTTKQRIIERELLFQNGDTLHYSSLTGIIEQTRKNLMNLSLFNFVNVEYVTIGEERGYNLLSIQINVTERWYIWPIPITLIEERNINEWWKQKNLEKLSYGMSLLVENFRGRNEILFLSAKTGFNEQYSVLYQVPNVNVQQNIGLGFSANYIREHNIIYNTFENRSVWLKLDTEYAFENIYLQMNLTKRKGIFKSHRFGLQFNNLWLSDTLLLLQPEFIENSNTSTSYFTLSYLLKHDFRDYKHYPLEGHYFDCEISKRGLSLLPDESVSTLQITSNLRKYWKLDSRLFYAIGITGQLRIDDNTSYLFNRSLGYGRNYLRGYENYVIDGHDFMLIKSNMKYNIISPNIKKIRFIRSPKFNTIPYAFYLNLHTDFGYVSDKYFAVNNPLNNSILFGYGVGIDFVTYYNSAYRFDVSRNLRNEWVISLQFIAPI